YAGGVEPRAMGVRAGPAADRGYYYLHDDGHDRPAAGGAIAPGRGGLLYPAAAQGAGAQGRPADERRGASGVRAGGLSELLVHVCVADAAVGRGGLREDQPAPERLARPGGPRPLSERARAGDLYGRSDLVHGVSAAADRGQAEGARLDLDGAAAGAARVAGAALRLPGA